jgi:hypothetical protein
MDSDNIERSFPTLLSTGIQEIGGVVLSGGDQTPEGMLDTPREYRYLIQLDSGEEIYLTYTAYPPSPAGQEQSKPMLDFYNGIIHIGDRVFAKGIFDAVTKTLIVSEESDFIRTMSK